MRLAAKSEEASKPSTYTILGMILFNGLRAMDKHSKSSQPPTRRAIRLSPIVSTVIRKRLAGKTLI